MVLGFTGAVPTALIGIFSVILLVIGSEKVVDRMEAVALHYRISTVVIAMTVISLGTSLPEITSHVVASYGILGGTLDYQVASATVLGGNIGSNVVQQTLIMGIVIVTAGSLRFKPRIIRRDFIPMIMAHVLTLALVLDGSISRIDGILLLGTFAAYMYFLYRNRHEVLFNGGDSRPSKRPRKDLFVAFLAMIMVVYSAHIFLQVVESTVEFTGIGGSMIGVVTLGVASALPELVTALEGVRKGAEGISIGTLIGSNITNPLVGIGIGSLISTYSVPRGLYLWDLPMEILTGGALLTYIFVIKEIPYISKRVPEKYTVGRKGGVMLIALYVFYVFIRFQYFSIDF